MTEPAAVELQLTAATRGAVHMVVEGRKATVCGRRARFRDGRDWPTWQLGTTELRQRKGCDTCWSLARSALLIGTVR